MYSIIHSAVVFGVGGLCIDIEMKLSRGLPSYNIVGLPDATVRESKERIRSAIESLDIRFPARRMTLNLIPAQTPKDGSHLDLSMAIAILCAVMDIDYTKWGDVAFFGELTLDGRLLPSSGLLPMVLALMERGIYKFIIPKGMEEDICYVPHIQYKCCSSLKEVYNLLMDASSSKFVEFIGGVNITYSNVRKSSAIDFTDVKGQVMAKRAFLISACGRHSIMLSGEPGSGKSMMVEAFLGILPNLDEEEAIDVQKIYSVTKHKRGIDSWFDRPFRRPHQNVTSIALIGGGHRPMPGEMSLAHRGVLFLDEITEFKRSALEALRQPLETGKVSISRAYSQISIPSNVCLVATMNPCKCGYLYSEDRECNCSDAQVRRYLSKISGPILDRIDMLVEVRRVKKNDECTVYKSSDDMYADVNRCWDIQKDRFKNYKNVGMVKFNGEMLAIDIEKYAAMTKSAKKVLDDTTEYFSYSQRVKDKLIKIARTIADIENSNNILSEHIAEAIQYRLPEKHLRGEGI